jgi:hypothetical protein
MDPTRWIDQDQRPHINPGMQRLHALSRLLVETVSGSVIES